MALYCELCGTRTDGVERLGVYCPGEYCGTDLRAGADAGVRAWCEPERRFGVAGGTVLVDLLVCNSGPRATGFHLDPSSAEPRPIARRNTATRRGPVGCTPPGAVAQ
ncbi:hypothetical protein [Kitasatospora purpeofusca]|uniref:hypothetical protein n=1 Tax=Kitasatospora purpeofusca TaxID=67352 RepID=UPI00365BD2DB